jgi:hypothetical protein
MKRFDIISLVFVVLAVFWILFVIIRLLGPAPAVQLPPPPELLTLPTLTPSFTPTITPIPSETPTPSDTPTPSITPTETPTLAPSSTITDTPGPTLTPSPTFTPSVSPTSTPTLTPTGPTETFTPTTSPFLYDLRDNQVVFTRNTFNSAACAWQGIGGQVYDFAGNEMDTSSGLHVHVFGSGVDQREQVGSNSIYGVSGWEVSVDQIINTNSYFVELESSAGTVISPRIQVDFPSDCDRNVALIRFIQTRSQ